MPSQAVELLAPVAGWSAPLAELSDAVFAQRMLGDGVAIDPTGGELVAPCDGEIISVAAARHAVALRSGQGVEVLMHVGLDTIALAGAGFEVHVKKGDRVHAGDKLLTFDLELLARKATSLLTPVIVTNGERFRIVSAFTGQKVAAGAKLLTLVTQGPAAVGAAPAPGHGQWPAVSESVVVRHARRCATGPRRWPSRLQTCVCSVPASAVARTCARSLCTPRGSSSASARLPQSTRPGSRAPAFGAWCKLPLPPGTSSSGPMRSKPRGRWTRSKKTRCDLSVSVMQLPLRTAAY